jgi:two-component system, OmpR family, sensor histidine kinase TctE
MGVTVPHVSPYPRTLSLRSRLAGMMGLLFLAGTVGLYIAARTYALAAADLSYDRLLSGAALSIEETLSVAQHEISVDIPYAALDMLSAAPEDRVFYRVIGPNGATVTGYDDLPAPTAASHRAGDGAPGSKKFFDAQYRGELVRFALHGRELAEPGATGWVWVQVGQTRRARQALARELVLGALLPIGAMTVLALSLVWFGIGGALRPLARIGHDLSDREPADLRPIATPVPVEMAPMVDALNGFMHRLNANIGTLRAFIAEAAHQMRTPLAALLAQAQLAPEDDPAQLRRTLRAVERNAARLTRLLNQLLSDATVIHRSDMRRFEPFDLLRMVRQAIHESVPLSGDADVQFHAPGGAAPFTGDRLMLCEALKNLIDNALRHGGAEGPVSIELEPTGDAYRLCVADRGPGIPLENRTRVFERFARGSSTAPGAGLGLAIVRQAVESHRGTITLLDRPGGGLIVELHLPRAGA